MSAIRPLATIAMLMVLGVFLWKQINTPDLKEETEGSLAAINAPALEADLGAGADTMDTAPPPFGPAEQTEEGEEELPEFDFGPAPLAEDDSSIAPLAEEDTAAMPELPPLPAQVPTANYADAAEEPAGADALAETENVEMEAGADPPFAGGALAGAGETAPLDGGTAGMPGDMNTTANSQVANEFAGAASAFASARPAIEAALARGELEEAHLKLSIWYGDRSLPLEEQEEIENLLSQLAGTVVYSTEHRLEAPHRVQASETLETIAQQYNVPWQLLAKINNIAEPSAVIPGQELKVIRGPFLAVVDVERQQLALMVANRYAGQFGVKVEGAATNEGEWVVTQKQVPDGDSKRLVLETSGALPGGPQVVLGPASDTAPATAGAIRVAPTDQDDLFDILSIGSRVLIRK